MKRAGRKSLAQTPSPKEERIYGSKVNKEGSASSETEAKSISFSDKVMEILKKKQREYNKENPSTKVSIDVLKAVFRRGAGAYSRSHRPTITGGRPNSRTAWAIARVNKFLEKRSGKEVKKAYIQDDDLLKKYSEGGRVIIGKPKVFYTRTYADGTKQEFSVEDYEKNVLPYHLGGDMSKHLAPNGKPSNLNHEQWHLVRTPEFKAWFGDWENDPENASKVVDENGEPLVVWHGSQSNDEFNVFKQSSRFEFIYFAKTKEYAWFHFTKDTIGNPFQLRPFFLNIRNLLNAEEYGFEKVDFSELKSFFYGIHKLDKDIQLNPKSEYRFWEILRFSNDIYHSIKNQGYYDGISFYENFYDNTTWNDTDDYTLSYVVMNPTQIKLANGSNTTFDPENPDIRFAKGGMVEVVLNEGNGVAINKLYNEWANIRTEKQQIAWAKKVRETKFGSYGTIGILEVLDKFEFMQSNKVNGVMKHDFIEEVKDALNSYAKGGSVEQTPIFGAVENSKYKGWSEEKVMSYDFPELYEIAEKHHAGYKTIRKEFIKGIFVEREHTSDWGMSAHVSLQHVFENPQYYTILQSLGL